MSVATAWNMEPDELRIEFPCDRLVAHSDVDLYRGITVEADPDIVFRWLCQLRVAPYSYDWIDNLGRVSPRALTPGLEELSVGQEVMGQFELVDYELSRHLTIRQRPTSYGTRIFGDIVGTYLILPKTPNSCRLLVKLRIKYPQGLIGKVMRLFLPLGDTIMMRRQLLNFKRLSEQQAMGSG